MTSAIVCNMCGKESQQGNVIHHPITTMSISLCEDCTVPTAESLFSLLSTSQQIVLRKRLDAGVDAPKTIVQQSSLMN